LAVAKGGLFLKEVMVAVAIANVSLSLMALGMLTTLSRSLKQREHLRLKCSLFVLLVI
jgi:hypothetical protein